MNRVELTAIIENFRDEFNRLATQANPHDIATLMLFSENIERLLENSKNPTVPLEETLESFQKMIDYDTKGENEQLEKTIQQSFASLSDDDKKQMYEAIKSLTPEDPNAAKIEAETAAQQDRAQFENAVSALKYLLQKQSKTTLLEKLNNLSAAYEETGAVEIYPHAKAFSEALLQAEAAATTAAEKKLMYEISANADPILFALDRLSRDTEHPTAFKAETKAQKSREVLAKAHEQIKILDAHMAAIHHPDIESVISSLEQFKKAINLWQKEHATVTPERKKELNRVLSQTYDDLTREFSHPKAQHLTQQNPIISTAWRALATGLNQLLKWIGVKDRLSTTSSDEAAQKTKQYMQEMKALQDPEQEESNSPKKP